MNSELKFLMGMSYFGTTPENYFKTVVENESLHEVEATQVFDLIR
jgi:hypothetical protein